MFFMQVLSFAPSNSSRNSAFALFQKKVEVIPIRITDIVDSLAGAASVHEQAVGLLASATHLLNSLGTLLLSLHPFILTPSTLTSTPSPPAPLTILFTSYS